MEQQFAADTVYLCRTQYYTNYTAVQQVASLKKVIQGIVYKEVALD